QLLQRVARECVGGLALLVEGEPREPVAVLHPAPVLRHRRGIEPVHQSASTSIAPPRPPPMQIAAMPRFLLVRLRVFSRCRTMRVPDAPTGCPSAIAPPSTLSFAWSSSPMARSSPSSSRQYFSSFHAARQPSTCAAKASLISQ